MKLSKRLQTIADMIPNGSRVIDVGCDHGLLSIFLAQEKHCICLATDVNEKALNNAIVNISKYNVNNIETILTDGINDLQINTEDYIVIAGMGTTTIKHILNFKKLSTHLIISSNNQLFELRDYITHLGYIIVKEEFVIEHQKKYVIIEFLKGKKKYSSLDLHYGPILKSNVDYLIYELEKLFKIKESVRFGNFIVRHNNQKEINKVQKLIDKAK